MKRFLFIVLIIIGLYNLSGCELFVIKGKKIIIEDTITTDYSVNSPIGIVNLFISELNNNNVLAATELLAKDNKSLYSVNEKYDLTGDVSRLKRYINNDEITNQSISSSDNKYNIEIEVAYFKKIIFEVQEINKRFYITNYYNK